MTRLDDIMARFARIPGSRLGHGPRHPHAPDRDIADRITSFLSDYPAATHDDGYVEFLEKYAGASIYNAATTQIVDLLGFTDASTDILEMDGPVVDDEGFLIVAQAIYHIDVGGQAVDTMQHDFALDTTGQRTPGLYHSFTKGSQLEPHFAWQHDNFTSWLESLVVVRGWLSPPGPPN